MFGNVLNNSQISHLIKNKEIEVDPFVQSNLRLAHYPLHPSKILEIGPIESSGKRKTKVLHDFENDDDYILSPDQYVVVEIAEYLRLPQGVVGHFVPASTLIEQGFGLTAGKLDPEYGLIKGKRQQVRFGLKNLKSQSNVILGKTHIAHVYFVDLRGLNNLNYSYTQAELKYLLDRFPRIARDSDDGVSYGDGNGD